MTALIHHCNRGIWLHDLCTPSTRKILIPMNTEILGVILMYATVLALAIPLGRYIGKVFNYENTWLDKIFNPLDKLFSN
jgi:hypothetical protein